MVSPELVRRYPVFGGLSAPQIAALAKSAEEMRVESGKSFFREGEELHAFYLVLEGAVAVVIEIPPQEREIVVSTVGPGELFGWSALISPATSTAGVRATTACRVVGFDCRQLREAFEEDPRFGYVMMQMVAGVARDRLHDSHIQSLAYYAEDRGRAS